jgi:hypothetical protein
MGAGDRRLLNSDLRCAIAIDAQLVAAPDALKRASEQSVGRRGFCLLQRGEMAKLEGWCHRESAISANAWARGLVQNRALRFNSVELDGR